MRVFKHVRKIPGYPDYMVIRDGRIISMKSKQPRTLKPHANQKGYLYVILYRADRRPKHMLIHRAVGMAFIENKEGKPQINHLDGIKTNNRVENLEWCTPSENLIHAFATGLKKNPGRKLTEKDILEIRKAAKDGAVLTYLAEDYGVSRPTISNIVHRKIWAHVKEAR